MISDPFCSCGSRISLDTIEKSLWVSSSYPQPSPIQSSTFLLFGSTCFANFTFSRSAEFIAMIFLCSLKSIVWIFSKTFLRWGLDCSWICGLTEDFQEIIIRKEIKSSEFLFFLLKIIFQFFLNHFKVLISLLVIFLIILLLYILVRHSLKHELDSLYVSKYYPQLWISWFLLAIVSRYQEPRRSVEDTSIGAWHFAHSSRISLIVFNC